MPDGKFTAERGNQNTVWRIDWLSFLACKKKKRQTDLDWFKKINDSLGHMAGDETLRKVAQNFQETFDKTGAVGRVGGDEFAVMIEEPMNRAQMEEKLLQFQRAISTILPEEKVSCSIGVYHFTFPQEIKHLLRETDMYMAKERGRACYVIQESPAGESEWCD